MYGSFPSARALLALALFMPAAACARKVPEAEAAIAAVTVGPEAITVVSTTTLSTGPAISGSLVADKTASIRAEASGRVIAVLVEPGVRVTTGTLLARIDDTSIREAVLSAKSAVTQMQLAADIAKKEEGRSERLLAAGAIADNALENAKRNNLAAQAQLEDAQARLAAAERNLENTLVKAPYDGIVSERPVNAGDVVTPGTALFTIVDPSTMRLEGAVPADQLGMVHLGAPVKFTITGYPGKSFTGAISNIYPSADPQTRQVRLFARIPNTGAGLVAGLYAQGRVSSDTHTALTAPLTAVDQRGIKPAVMRLKDGKVERVEVGLGMRDEATERIEITSGIAAGDTLLVGAAQGITAGTPVKVAAAAPSADQPQKK